MPENSPGGDAVCKTAGNVNKSMVGSSPTSNTIMKTVLYRIQSIEASEGEGFRYNSLRTLSDTKVNEEMCLRNEFGDHYLINDPDY